MIYVPPAAHPTLGVGVTSRLASPRSSNRAANTDRPPTSWNPGREACGMVSTGQASRIVGRREVRTRHLFHARGVVIPPVMGYLPISSRQDHSRDESPPPSSVDLPIPILTGPGPVALPAGGPTKGDQLVRFIEATVLN